MFCGTFIAYLFSINCTIIDPSSPFETCQEAAITAWNDYQVGWYDRGKSLSFDKSRPAWVYEHDGHKILYTCTK